MLYNKTAVPGIRPRKAASARGFREYRLRARLAFLTKGPDDPEAQAAELLDLKTEAEAQAKQQNATSYS